MRLDGLNRIAKALINVGVSPKAIPEEMADGINKYQTATGNNLAFEYISASSEGKFRIANEQRVAYFHIQKPNTVRLLSTKVDGVTVQFNLHKPGNYDHDNETLVKALRYLANLIDSLAIRLADQDSFSL